MTLDPEKHNPDSVHKNYLCDDECPLQAKVYMKKIVITITALIAVLFSVTLINVYLKTRTVDISKEAYDKILKEQTNAHPAD